LKKKNDGIPPLNPLGESEPHAVVSMQGYANRSIINPLDVNASLKLDMRAQFRQFSSKMRKIRHLFGPERGFLRTNYRFFSKFDPPAARETIGQELFMERLSFLCANPSPAHHHFRTI